VGMANVLNQDEETTSLSSGTAGLPCSTAYCAMATCSSAARGAGAPSWGRRNNRRLRILRTGAVAVQKTESARSRAENKRSRR
jgi:hypothetical protein